MTTLRSIARLIRFEIANTLLLMNTTSPLLLFAAAGIALFCLRLLLSPQSRVRR